MLNAEERYCCKERISDSVGSRRWKGRGSTAAFFNLGADFWGCNDPSFGNEEEGDGEFLNSSQ
jgi:hypothetical protein